MNNKLSIFLRILSIGLQLAYVKSYTHYLSVTELGYSFYLTALSYALNALILVPADYYQQARLSAYHNAFPVRSVLALNARIMLATGVFTGTIGVPIWIAGKLSFVDLLLILWLALFLYFSTSLRNYLNNRGHSLFTGWMLFIEAALKVVSFLLLFFLGASPIHAFVLSTIIAFLIEVLGLVIFFYMRVPCTQDAASDLGFKSLLRTSSAVSFSAICNWCQLQGYRVVYVWVGLPEIAGLYAAVSNLGTLGMNASSTVFSQMLLPKVYSSKGTYIFQYLKYALMLCFVILLGYFLLGKVLLYVLTKKAFEPYSSLMLFGILVEAGNFLVGAASIYFTIRRTVFHLVAANIAGLFAACLGIAACIVWRPQNYYFLGAALALSQVVVCAMLFEKAKQDMSREVHNAQIFE